MPRRAFEDVVLPHLDAAFQCVRCADAERRLARTMWCRMRTLGPCDFCRLCAVMTRARGW
jgi:late competence protein required for DNA uptake (superfamily II DNA/RNA helicase)